MHSGNLRRLSLREAVEDILILSGQGPKTPPAFEASMAVRERSACYLLPTAFPSTFYHFVTPARFPADPSAIFLAEGGCASGAERLPV